jgi:hypothetical protein
MVGKELEDAVASELGGMSRAVGIEMKDLSLAIKAGLDLVQ